MSDEIKDSGGKGFFMFKVFFFFFMVIITWAYVYWSNFQLEF